MEVGELSRLSPVTVVIGPVVRRRAFWLDLAQLEGISNYWPVAVGW